MNNYQEFKNFLENIDLNHKPTLLLHSCCAPCSTHVLWLLKKYFKITILYDNPNIYPYEEYIKRVEEIKKILNEPEFNDISLVISEYDYNQYLDVIKGYEDQIEGSKRCYLCYKLRLKHTAEYAINHQFAYFTTTLSISPYKNSNWINEIGLIYENDKTKFLYSNFKKEEGYKHSIILSKQYNLYRQEYCGCEFSLIEAKKKQDTKKSI